MSKQSRLVDFQVFCRGGRDQRAVNEALFATYEPVHLWLTEHALTAPFRKLLVSLADETSASPWHGSAAISGHVCEVTEAVAYPGLLEHVRDHQWVFGVVMHALQSISRTVAWNSKELTDLVTELSAQSWPLVTMLGHLAQTDRPTGIMCVPWFSAQPGLSVLGVRIASNAAAQDVKVESKAGPLFLEDDFPVKETAIREGTFLLLDKDGRTLASVPLVRGG